MSVSEQYYSFNKNKFNVNDEILVDTSGRNILIDSSRVVFDDVKEGKIILFLLFLVQYFLD